MAVEERTQDINLTQFKYKPKVNSLMKKLADNEINVETLNEFEISELIKCILIISR